MRQFSFATIITAENAFPIAPHLPFIVAVKDEHVMLTSHFAKANQQWRDIETSQVLVIFSEPHAHISPRNYEKALNVPTWNYISVHAYGKGKLVSDTNEIFNLLEATIDNYETSYRHQWDSLPEDYKRKMANGIVGFEIRVSELQAKKKSSQNRTEIEKQNIIDALSKSSDANEKKIADFMKQHDVGAV